MKQIKKLSLSNVIGKLTRNEMRYVMAGSGTGSADDCLAAKFQAFNDARAAGFSVEDASGMSYSVYFMCMSLIV